MATMASVVLEDVRFTEKQLGIGLVVEIVDGATQGSETAELVLGDSSRTLTVTVEAGVSTADDIVAAVNGTPSVAEYVLAEATGTGAELAAAAGPSTATGGAGDPVDYYIRDNGDQALTNSFVPFFLPIPANRLEITNDETSGTKTVIVSFNGSDVDVPLTFGQSAEYTKDGSYFRVVWLKYGVGAPAYRLRAWL